MPPPFWYISRKKKNLHSELNALIAVIIAIKPLYMRFHLKSDMQQL